VITLIHTVGLMSLDIFDLNSYPFFGDAWCNAPERNDPRMRRLFPIFSIGLRSTKFYCWAPLGFLEGENLLQMSQVFFAT
jgi:hypothetical protein